VPAESAHSVSLSAVSQTIGLGIEGRAFVRELRSVLSGISLQKKGRQPEVPAAAFFMSWPEDQAALSALSA
jgi:hypothetical protein